MPDLARLLAEALAPAFHAVAGEVVDPVVRRSDRADFQANGALALARRLGRNPREVAAEVAMSADLAGLAEVEVAGPGFLNLSVTNQGLSAALADMNGDRLGVPTPSRPDTVVVDYSGPNAAKEMHVGHLRSTIIGDAIVRILTFRGDRVIRRNHVGDWGTPFGMLIEHLLDTGGDKELSGTSLGDLNSFYRAARQKFDEDEAFKSRAQRRVVELQAGDEETLRLWRFLVEMSAVSFQSVYDALGVLLEPADLWGESRYNSSLPSVIGDLEALGLTEVSDGATCVFPDGFHNRDGDRLPFIVRKADGGYGYPATDLAALRHRIRDLGATRVVYVVGLPQREHFEMLAAVSRAAGWLGEGVRVDFAGFGSVLSAEGRVLRSRAGDAPRLSDLLDEAVQRASAMMDARGTELDPDRRTAVARAVGIGALKYADLSNDRTKDYVFDWERMLSLEGNTAPYLQYAHARVQSIFRRGGIVAASLPSTPPLIAAGSERQLAIELLSLAGVLEDVFDDLRPHRLCAYLFGLSQAFTRFYENCPVLTAEEPVRTSRLQLCHLTARVLGRALDLLGIDSPDRM